MAFTIAQGGIWILVWGGFIIFIASLMVNSYSLVHKFLNIYTFLVILPLYTTTVVIKENTQHVTEVQNLALFKGFGKSIA